MAYHDPKEPTELEYGWLKTLEVDIVKGKLYRNGKEFGYIDPGSGYHKVISIGRHLKRTNIVWWKATGEWPKHMLDHKDRDRTNDSIDNLAYINNSANAINTSGGRISKYGCPKGVTYNPTKTNKTTVWVATLVREGKKRHIGRYRTMIEAAEAYEAARRAYDDKTNASS